MSVDLQTRLYNTYGFETLGSTLAGSRKWLHAATQNGLDRNTATQLFNDYDNHSFFNTARAAGGYLGKYQSIDNQRKNSTRPKSVLGYTGFDGRGFDTGRTAGRDYDPFSDLRLEGGSFFKDKIGLKVDGDKVSFYDQVYKDQRIPTGYGPSRSQKVATGQRGQQQTGRVLNGTFVPDQIYSQLSDTDKEFYGKRFSEARQFDSRLNEAATVVDSAYQYRRERSRTKGGIGALTQIGSTLLGRTPGAGDTPRAAVPTASPSAQSPRTVTQSAISGNNRGRRRTLLGRTPSSILSGGTLSGNTGKVTLG